MAERGRRRLVNGILVGALICGITLQVPRSAAQATPARAGGTLTVEFLDDISHLDTALCYDNQCYPFAKAMFDRLVDYAGAGDKLVPDAAAAMPAITNGGHTYTFTLRNDVHFWNGRLATASDWAYSFERIINPKIQSGASSFWMNIVGADAYASGKAQHAAGIKAPSPFKLEIDLVSPDASFLNVLAMPFGSVVDKNQIAKYGRSYDSQHPMGTGPYMFSRHVLGRELVLVKNPHYFLANAGKVDTIRGEIGVSTETALLRI
ncbi:MAG: transporter substrate-binding protein [Chloroflexi bacterium]|nr:transporter substrate-binding protein [Chloroflexota bacterium]